MKRSVWSAIAGSLMLAATTWPAFAAEGTTDIKVALLDMSSLMPTGMAGYGMMYPGTLGQGMMGQGMMGQGMMGYGMMGRGMMGGWQGQQTNP